MMKKFSAQVFKGDHLLFDVAGIDASTREQALMQLNEYILRELKIVIKRECESREKKT